MLAELQRIHGVRLLDPTGAQAAYGADTGGAVRALAGAMVLGEAEALSQVLAWANRHRQALWPISGGRNFGYGTALPVCSGAWILDLSQLKRIEYHAESQSVWIEAGVTQGELRDFLDRAQLPYLVPTTGAGPHGSLIGNALDGGYGLNPVSDHFEGLSRLQGHWGNGEPFDHSLASLGLADLSERWPVGLGLEPRALLRQSAAGIVVRASLQLARRSESARLVFVEWPNADAFVAAQDELSMLVEDLPQLTGLLSMNAARTLAAMPHGPFADAPQGMERRAHVERVIRQRGMAAWTSLGTLYGARSSVAGAAADLRRRLRPYRARVFNLSPWLIRQLLRWRSLAPAAWQAKIQSLGHALDMLEGRPVAEFLQLAYALDPTRPRVDASRHPARDGQGIVWYAPLVPLSARGVRAHLELVGPILERHGFDPLLATTTRNSRTCIATIPLLFHRTPEGLARARRCHDDLLNEGWQQGMLPYRFGVEHMGWLHAHRNASSADWMEQVRRCLDPNGVVAPGRYSGLTQGAGAARQCG